jgi:hypothetical protein
MIQPPDGLWGPFDLTLPGIDAAITATCAGVYALGKLEDRDGRFQVRYLKRDDRDVKRRLKGHVASWYPFFLYKHYLSPRQAFEKECDLYHRFNPPDNKSHPARPEKTDWKCPHCQAPK